MTWPIWLSGTIDKTAHTDIRMSPAIIISLSEQNVKLGYKTGQRPAYLCCTYGLSVHQPRDVGCGPRWAGCAVCLQLLSNLVSRLRCQHLWPFALLLCAHRQVMSAIYFNSPLDCWSPKKAAIIGPQLNLLSAKMYAGCSSTCSVSGSVSVDHFSDVQ
jgi:hypothetical protein